MQKQELDNLMQDVAQDAITYAKDEYHIELDYSLESLNKLDEILNSLHHLEQEKRHSAELIFTICNILGAYAGEVFIKHVGGQWQHNTNDNAAPFVYIQLNDKEFPLSSICYHKITRDNSINLFNYVKQAKANAMQ